MTTFIKVIIACLLLTLLFGCTVPNDTNDVNNIPSDKNVWFNYVIPVADFNLVQVSLRDYEYLLGGQKYIYTFRVYGEINDYLNKFPTWYGCTRGCPTQEQYIKLAIFEPQSQKYLKKIATDFNAFPFKSEDKVRALVSMVQSMDYNTNKSDILESFPYQVLFDKQGICGEKTMLLLNILSDMGYKTAYLSFPDINHSAVGIGCDGNYDFRDSGYCYIESTKPMIITDTNVGPDLAALNITKLNIYPISIGNNFNATLDNNARLQYYYFISHSEDVNFDFQSFYYFNTYWGLNKTECDSNLILCLGACWQKCSVGEFKCQSTGAVCQ